MKNRFGIVLSLVLSFFFTSSYASKKSIHYFSEKDLELVLNCLVDKDCETASRINSLAVVKLVLQDTSKEIKHVVGKK